MEELSNELKEKIDNAIAAMGPLDGLAEAMANGQIKEFWLEKINLLAPAIVEIFKEMTSSSAPAKVDAVEKAINELATALTDDLFARLAQVNGPLEQESREQTEKAATLRESHEKLQPIAEAKSRVLSGEIDKALLEGRTDDVQLKRREIEELKANLQGILTQADGCEARVRQLGEEQTRNWRIVFDQTYPEIRQASCAVVIAAIQFLDKLWAGLQRYSDQSGLALLHTYHKDNLTPMEHGPERAWFQKTLEWFGGRLD
jgi:hypothetical protein